MGAGMPQPFQQKASIASIEKWSNAKIKEGREIWWMNNIPKTYKNLEIKDAPKFPKELLLNRKSLGRLLAARTGHGDFARYHTRFSHTDARMDCRCGSAKTPIHFLFCRILRRRQGRPTGPIKQLIPNLLGTTKGAITLSKWFESSRFFEDICP